MNYVSLQAFLEIFFYQSDILELRTQTVKFVDTPRNFIAWIYVRRTIDLGRDLSEIEEVPFVTRNSRHSSKHHLVGVDSTVIWQMPFWAENR